MEILAFEEPVDRLYGKLRAQQEAKGQVLGGNDLLIAAQTISLGFILVTANKREFAHVSELQCESWLTTESPAKRTR